jgi:ethanolamine kinase
MPRFDFIQARQAPRPPLASVDNTTNDPSSSASTGNTSNNATDEFYRVLVDDKPYFPFLDVVEEEEEEDTSTSTSTATASSGPPSSPSWTKMIPSVKRAVAAMFDLTPAANSHHLVVTQVQGGNTNVLFCVAGLPKCAKKEQEHKDNTSTSTNIPDKVLVRIFGGQGLIDRDAETSTYAALAAQGLALEYHGRFGNGRIEGWFDDGRCLTEDDLAPNALAIARSLATLHTTFTTPSTTTTQTTTTRPTLWVQLEDWITTAVEATFPTLCDTQRATALNLPQWQDELAFLQDHVIIESKDSDASAIGFCHNDVLASNIMVKINNDNPTAKSNDDNDDGNHNVQLIDFEYGGLNYLLYDIANHFNEYAGGTDASATPDYDRFPSHDLQTAFCREYLTTTTRRRQQQRMLLLQQNKDGDDGKHPTTTITITPPPEPQLPSEPEVRKCLREIAGFVLCNHLVWALWAVNQASTAGCTDFDYLTYARYRMQRYYENKNEWIHDQQQQ